MSGMYWGLTAMALMGRLGDMDTGAVAEWVLTCRKEGGGFGASPRNDPHMLYTLSAVQVRANWRGAAARLARAAGTPPGWSYARMRAKRTRHGSNLPSPNPPSRRRSWRCWTSSTSSTLTRSQTVSKGGGGAPVR